MAILASKLPFFISRPALQVLQDSLRNLLSGASEVSVDLITEAAPRLQKVALRLSDLLRLPLTDVDT